jgi:predicted HicB family RNase H-like nuclease
VRLNDDDRRRIEEAAKASNQSMSQWIRSTLNAALEA